MLSAASAGVTPTSSSYAVQAAVMCMCVGFTMAGFAFEKWSGKVEIRLVSGQSDPLCEPLCEWTKWSGKVEWTK